MMHSPNELKASLSYRDGRVYWRIGKNAGKEAGAARRDGRWVIKFGGRDGKVYLRYRVIWAIEHGEWPAGELDHVNCDASDDHLENLRPATSSQNKANCKARRTNAVGLKGVMPHQGRYMAQIGAGGRSIYLGVFDTPKQAHDAYKAAAAEKYGEFARA